MKSEQLSQLVKEAIKTQFKLDIEPEIVYAPSGKGDFSTSAAFQISGGKNPVEAAKKLAASISAPALDRVTTEGPYINFWLKDSAWESELRDFGQSYGAVSGMAQKIQVEFISANPTGPLTIGNARGGFIGDVLANVLESQGNKVVREYYFNDAGTQISKLVESIKASAGIISPAEVQYKGKYIEDVAKAINLEASDDEIAKQATKLIFDRYIKPAIQKMGIKFDAWFNERTLKDSGQFDLAMKLLKEKSLLNEKEGAVWLLSGKLGDDRDERVLVKSNETKDVTYLGNDIPYHLDIFGERGFDRAVKVWGADHAGQVNSLKLVIEELMPGKKLDFLIAQWVRLIRDGKEIKSGKRTGNFVTVEDVLEEIPADVARFFFLMRSADSHMDFDLNLAKEQTQKNPYWYVMYAYVRGRSILAKASGKGLIAGKSVVLDGKEREITRQASQLPGLLSEIAENNDVHKLTFFGQSVAQLFHDYYETTRIIDLPDTEASGKLYFVQQMCAFWERYFSILGIKPIEKM